MVKERNIILVVLFSIITFGIYAIYWLYATSKEMSELGSTEAPSPIMIILIFIPIANLVYLWKYSKATEQISEGRVNGIVYFIVWLVIGIVAMILTQLELNKHVSGGGTPQATTDAPAATPEQPQIDAQQQPEQPAMDAPQEQPDQSQEPQPPM